MAPLLIKDLLPAALCSILLRVLVNPTEADMMAALAHSGHLGLTEEIELRALDLKRLEAELAPARRALRRRKRRSRRGGRRGRPSSAQSRSMRGFTIHGSLGC